MRPLSGRVGTVPCRRNKRFEAREESSGGRQGVRGAQEEGELLLVLVYLRHTDRPS